LANRKIKILTQILWVKINVGITNSLLMFSHT